MRVGKTKMDNPKRQRVGENEKRKKERERTEDILLDPPQTNSQVELDYTINPLHPTVRPEHSELTSNASHSQTLSSRAMGLYPVLGWDLINQKAKSHLQT